MCPLRVHDRAGTTQQTNSNSNTPATQQHRTERLKPIADTATQPHPPNPTQLHATPRHTTPHPQQLTPQHHLHKRSKVVLLPTWPSGPSPRHGSANPTRFHLCTKQHTHLLCFFSLSLSGRSDQDVKDNDGRAYRNEERCDRIKRAVSRTWQTETPSALDYSRSSNTTPLR